MMIHVHSKNGHVTKRVSEVRDRFMEKVFDDAAVRLSRATDKFYLEKMADYVLHGSGEIQALRTVRDNPGKPYTFSRAHAEQLNRFPMFISPMVTSSLEHHPDYIRPGKLVAMTSTTDLISVKECKERVIDAAQDFAKVQWWDLDGRITARRNLKYWVNRLGELEEQYAVHR